ncbi:MAG TPA: AMP-binding protein [Deltaproteobacteria bacterium]|nr:AMP-binding protein [Deltaproteobacteria bacterium]HOI06756.1 AMP-binding protein [Deltaproteobacteria bacterium]
MKINQKELVRRLLGFLNFRNMIKMTMWNLASRRNRTFFIFEGREYTYGEVYRQSERYADFFLAERRKLVASGRLKSDERFSLGIYTDNVPEFLFASFGAGLSNSVLFAVNTGFRGETLAKVIDQAKISLLLVNESTVAEVDRIVSDISVLGRDDILFIGPKEGSGGYRTVEEAISASEGLASKDYLVPVDNFSPVIVIYTSGMTGMPKGVPCTHIKLVGAGFKVRFDTGLKSTDRGYISMPLFHSNAWYIGILPQLVAGGSFVLKRKFSARAFEEDMLEHGVTFLNYVGQPLHYIIEALEKKYGSPEAVEKALANHPKNRFRIAYGNGATALDRKKLMKCLNMEHIYEIYGSTEAVITTANKPGDPIESVGKVPASVKILDAQGRECQPGIVDENGQLKNYDQAVGEICALVGSDNLRFEGYYGNADATSQKFRDGVYHSGDLGHIRLIKGKRYLYFNGRTDDWIRKDGENFSAEDVVRYASEIPCVDCAIAYGAPCEVSDEKVMVTVQLLPGQTFNPDEVHAWLMRQQKEGGMDPKWMPDYIRVIESFPVTETQKIIVRPFKREHFNLEASPDMEIWYRTKGDTTYRRLTPEGYQEIKQGFIKTGRESLLSQG